MRTQSGARCAFLKTSSKTKGVIAMQHGSIWYDKKSRAFYGRWREDVWVNGEVKRKQRCVFLTKKDDRYRCKKDVAPLFAEKFAPVHQGKADARSTMPLGDFVKDHYLPWAKQNLKPSTAYTHANRWQAIAPYCEDVILRDFRTVDCAELLDKLCKRGWSRATLHRVKSLFSAIFRYAKNIGVLDGLNPIQDTMIPGNARPPAETCAYTLDEVRAMLSALPEPAKTIIACAAFTGFRKSELQGLEWSDYDGDTLCVSRAIWQGKVGEPKTAKSRAAVPVIPQLRQMLDNSRGHRLQGPIFAGINGKPLRLDNLTARVIIPCLRVAGITWHGWHGLRRGLATNLHQMGVDDKTTQAILRHSSIGLTQNTYIKAIPEASVTAMQKFSNVVQPLVN
ncbi:MAG: tyrosine-type recombinase/integrase [Terriglobia bacterium]